MKRQQCCDHTLERHMTKKVGIVHHPTVLTNIDVMTYHILPHINIKDLLNFLITCKNMFYHYIQIYMKRSIIWRNSTLQEWYNIVNMKHHILKPIATCILQNVQSVWDYDNTIPYYWLPRLKRLELSDSDSEVLSHLPQNVTSLYIGNAISEKIHVSHLPINLETLSMGIHFNQSFVGGNLPSKLCTLYLGTNYTKNIQHIIPPSVRTLHLGDNFNHRFTTCMQRTNIRNLFISLRYTSLLQNCPSGLQFLHMGTTYNNKLLPNVLPHTLSTLILSEQYNQQIDACVLPKNLQHLVTGSMFNFHLGLSNLPRQLKYLYLGFSYNQPFMPYDIPDTLECLDFCKFGKYNHVIPHNGLGHTLKRLSLNITYIHQLQPTILYPPLRHLTINKSALCVDTLVLPSSLETIILIGQEKMSYISHTIWPVSLKHIITEIDCTYVIPVRYTHVYHIGHEHNRFIYSIDSLSLKLISLLATKSDSTGYRIATKHTDVQFIIL